MNGHSKALHIGKRVGKVTVARLDTLTYVVVCDCGRQAVRKNGQPIPNMCRACSTEQRKGFQIKDSDRELIIRANTKQESDMIKQFKKDNR